MANRVFFAAKINIHGNIFSPSIEELIFVRIPKVILESSPIKVNTWNWSFTDVDELVNGEDKIIVGNVTKSKFAKQKVRIGTKTEQRLSEHELAHTAYFVYDVRREILAHESTSSISAEEFRHFFEELLSRDPHVGVVKVKSIPEPYKIRQELLSVDKVTSIEFHLIHPNYGREEFNLFQDIIKDAGLKELDVKMANKEGIELLGKEKPVEINSEVESLVETSGQHESLARHDPRKLKEETGVVENINESSNVVKVRYQAGGFNRVIENGISLVESGYGDFKFRGFNEYVRKGKTNKTIIEKKKKSFSSRSSIRSIKINPNDSQTVLERILKFVKDVKGKLIKEGDRNDE